MFSVVVQFVTPGLTHGTRAVRGIFPDKQDAFLRTNMHELKSVLLPVNYCLLRSISLVPALMYMHVRVHMKVNYTKGEGMNNHGGSLGGDRKRSGKKEYEGRGRG